MNMCGSLACSKVSETSAAVLNTQTLQNLSGENRDEGAAFIAAAAAAAPALFNIYIITQNYYITVFLIPYLTIII